MGQNMCGRDHSPKDYLKCHAMYPLKLELLLNKLNNFVTSIASVWICSWQAKPGEQLPVWRGSDNN